MNELFPNTDNKQNEFGLRGRVMRESGSPMQYREPSPDESEVMLSGSEITSSSTILPTIENRFSLQDKTHLLEYITPTSLAVVGVLLALPVLYFVNFRNFSASIDPTKISQARQSLSVLTGDTTSDVDIKIKQQEEDAQKEAMVQALTGAQATTGTQNVQSTPTPSTIRYNFAKIRDTAPTARKEIPSATPYVTPQNPRTENILLDRMQQ